MPRQTIETEAYYFRCLDCIYQTRKKFYAKGHLEMHRSHRIVFEHVTLREV